MKSLAILLSLLVLGACDQANQLAAGAIGDQVARQTSAFQRATAAGDWRAIAAEPVVECQREPEACGKLHGMRANACLTLAMEARTDRRIACPAPGAEVNAWLDCAVRDYAAALPMLPPAQHPGTNANRANALYCRAEGKTVVGGLTDAGAAEQVGTQSGDALGLLWAARGAMLQARAGAGAPATRCAALGRANTLAARGVTMGNPTANAGFDGVRADIAALRPTIAGCSL
jgi:hypothetical protein